MNKVAVVIKGALAGIGALVTELLGGVDTLLVLLFTLIICDIVTGLLKAIIHKNVSSTEMRNGIIHKAFIFILIIIAVRLDVVVTEYFAKDFHFRAFVIAFFCLEELISVLENVANAGVPIPKWLRTILKQVSNEVNTSVPRGIVEFFKKKFNIDIKTEGKNEKSELKDESSSLVESNEEEAGLTEDSSDTENK